MLTINPNEDYYSAQVLGLAHAGELQEPCKPDPKQDFQ